MTGSLLLDDDAVYGNFTEVTWSQGVTGSPAAAAARSRRCRGRWHELTRCAAACTPATRRARLRTAPDYYSDLLGGAARHAALSHAERRESDRSREVAVEFYNHELDHYFPVHESGRDRQHLDSGIAHPRMAAHGPALPGLRQAAQPRHEPPVMPLSIAHRRTATCTSIRRAPRNARPRRRRHPGRLDLDESPGSVFYVNLPERDDGRVRGGDDPRVPLFQPTPRPIIATRPKS